MARIKQTVSILVNFIHITYGFRLIEPEAGKRPIRIWLVRRYVSLYQLLEVVRVKMFA